LIVSDALVSIPFSNNSAGNVEFRDPRIDFDLQDVVSNLTATATKTYQFNPRFVSRDLSGDTPSPIFYLRVAIAEINETDLTENTVVDEVTNGEGRLENGAVFLKRQGLASNEVQTDFSHRIILQGAGFKLSNEVIQITSPSTGDRPVDRIAPDYEGEFGE